MKQGLLYTLGPIVLIMVAFATSPAQVQRQLQQVQPVVPATLETTVVGPYYAIPAWDQQLPASTRFIVLSNWGNAAVLDKETGLVWERSPITKAVNWANASQYCINLTVGNRKGWRLPTIQDLASLVDPSQTSGLRLPYGHPFSNVRLLQKVPDTVNMYEGMYWSATTYSASPSNAWALWFNSGGSEGVFIKSNGFGLAWCVRGGQGVDAQ